MEQKDLAVQGTTDLTIFEGAETGFEGTDAQTFKTPFMRIIQALSPEVRQSDPKYIKEAQVGMFCNSATQQISTELEVVIIKVEHSLLVWKPERGGFAGRHSKAEESKVVFNSEGLKKWDEDGNDVMDTIEFYCMSINDPMDVFIFPLSGASIKHAKSFATRLRTLKVNEKPVGVTWAGVWKIRSVEESNKHGIWQSIGGTPELSRIVTKEEVDNMIKPALEMFKRAETDYSVIEETVVSSDGTDTGDNVEF